MIFLEGFARPLLICHGIAAAILVGASTHQLLWCRHYLAGRYGRARAERRFGTITAAAFVATFAMGNLLYPSYKVRVRAEYFDNAPAIAAELATRAQAQREVGTPRASVAPEAALRPTLASIARLFDIKEHWVALGCAASVLLWILSRKAHPKDRPEVLPLYLGLAAVQCGTAWLGAIVGLVTASFRAVGSVT